MKTALIIGHNARSKGAYSNVVGSEYDYWKRIAEKVKAEIPNLVVVYERQPNDNYLKEMRKVLTELNKRDYKYCLELHFNASSSEKANGCECIVYKGNKKAEVLANNFLDKASNTFKVRKRGILKTESRFDRGGYGICMSKDTYLLLEPFFGSNPDESLKFADEQKVVKLFVDYIKEVQV